MADDQGTPIPLYEATHERQAQLEAGDALERVFGAYNRNVRYWRRSFIVAFALLTGSLLGAVLLLQVAKSDLQAQNDHLASQNDHLADQNDALADQNQVLNRDVMELQRQIQALEDLLRAEGVGRPTADPDSESSSESDDTSVDAERALPSSEPPQDRSPPDPAPEHSPSTTSPSTTTSTTTASGLFEPQVHLPTSTTTSTTTTTTEAGLLSMLPVRPLPTVSINNERSNPMESSTPEALVVFGMLMALAWKLVDVGKYVLNRDWVQVRTQALLWGAGVAAIFLGSVSDWSDSLVVPGTGLPLSDVNGWSKLFLGLSVLSAASVIYDFKKALDGSDSASVPPLARPPHDG